MTIGILLCVWDRIEERLEHTLKLLHAQTMQDFTLILINNNFPKKNLVNSIVKSYGFPINITYHNKDNLGPYSRILKAQSLKNLFDYFMTIDDDLDFQNDLIEQWYNQKDCAMLQGWNGFNFIPKETYWDRTQVNSGDTAQYLWGSNLFFNSNIFNVRTPWLLEYLPEKYHLSCDDLWLCFNVHHFLNLPLRKGDITGNHINIDGKDTYLKSHDLKDELFQKLRLNKGWKV